MSAFRSMPASILSTASPGLPSTWSTRRTSTTWSAVPCRRCNPLPHHALAIRRDATGKHHSIRQGQGRAGSPRDPVGLHSPACPSNTPRQGCASSPRARTRSAGAGRLPGRRASGSGHGVVAVGRDHSVHRFELHPEEAGVEEAQVDRVGQCAGEAKSTRDRHRNCTQPPLPEPGGSSPATGARGSYHGPGRCRTALRCSPTSRRSSASASSSATMDVRCGGAIDGRDRRPGRIDDAHDDRHGRPRGRDLRRGEAAPAAGARPARGGLARIARCGASSICGSSARP